MTTGVDAYIRFYETMTPESLARLPELVTPDVHFVDPFNDITGVAPLRRILARMFEDLREPRFVDVGNGHAQRAHADEHRISSLFHS